MRIKCWTPPHVGVWNRYHLSNWRFYGEMVHFFLVREGSFSAISHYGFNECRPSAVSSCIANFGVAKSPKMALLGPKKCSALLKKRSQFDRWYPFHAYTPPTPTPEFLTKDFRLQPRLEWNFLLRRTWSVQKLLALQFPGRSLPQKGESGFLSKGFSFWTRLRK